MRLEVSQGLWVPNTFEHDVRVALVLDTHPVSIWTGAADGKIVLWSFDPSSTTKDVLPLALLCGHTAAIVGLQGCQGGVFSVCSERGLCVWDSSTGRCLRRRRLPPSIAQPTAVSSVPGSTNNVCIGYLSSGSDHSKGGVLILDTSTLRVVQNIYHGVLGLAEINDLVVSAQPQELDCSVFCADFQGRIQVFSKTKCNLEVGIGGSRAKAVSLSNDGKILLLVSSEGWTLKALGSGSIIFQRDSKCLVGGYFLRDDLQNRFLVWDEQGSATVYSLVLANDEVAVSVAPIIVIPDVEESCGSKARFCSGGGIFVRIDEANVALWITTLVDATGPITDQTAAGRGWLCKGLDCKVDGSITSSLLVPSFRHVPSILVCGYDNGSIDLVELKAGKNVSSPCYDNQYQDSSVLCLAVQDSESGQVLLSGNMNGSVCLWDLGSVERKLITFLHPHIAPVRQFVLPSSEAPSPWNHCFVSVADDASVALSSMTSLRTERIFPGHTGAIQQVVWDEFRAYLVALCTTSDGQVLLYVWDIHSGARERILRGAAAHSMLKHFVGRKRRTTELHADLTSASSLLLPIDDVQSPVAAQGQEQTNLHSKQRAIRAGCPFPGIAAIHLDMTVLLSTVDEELLKMSLSVLHLWEIDKELDKCVANDLQVFQPRQHRLGAGIAGNRGSVTLILPTKDATAKFWSSSTAMFSMRALTMVSLAQRLLTVSAPGSMICSALAAFYTAGAVEKLDGNCLEIYACFWQDPAEHVRLAARLLFHAAACTAVPDILKHDVGSSSAELLDWLESSEGQEGWLGLTGGTDQDGRACRIITCGALAVWHKSVVRHDLAISTAPLLLKLVRTSDRHSATAAEVLSAGMAGTWQQLLLPQELSQLTSDVISLVQCIGAAAAASEHHRSLLATLASTDMLHFLHALYGTPSWSVLLGLTSVVNVVRSSPLSVISFIGRIVSLAVQLLDPADSAQRRHNFPLVMDLLKEMAHVFPMVALYFPSSQSVASKLAVGDPVGDIRSLAIHVYDLHSASVMKVLDASGPPGHPALSSSVKNSSRTQGITALSFSKDGEGLVAFSHEGLIIRWWSIGAAWWDKLSRSLVPVQCTKLVLVPPSPGFSPKSSSTSIMSNLKSFEDGEQKQEQNDDSENEQTIDLSFRLYWKSDRVVVLNRGGQQVGIFQL